MTDEDASRDHLLAIDIGNTSVAIGVFDDDTLVATFRIATDQDNFADEYAILLLGLLRSKDLSPDDIGAAIVSSTVPPLILTFQEVCRDHFGVDPIIVGPGVKTGVRMTPGLWANRENAAMRFQWEIVKRPAGSEAAFTNPTGAVRLSTPYEYHYLDGHQPTFVADEPGEYRIRVTAELAFPDPQYPDVQRAQYETVFAAEGASLASGCSTSGAPTSGDASIFGALLALGGLFFARRRRG